MKKYKGNELKAFKAGLSEGTRRALILFVWILYDKWGFRRTRIERYGGQIAELRDSVNRGYVSYQDIEKTLEDEMETKFRGTWW